MDTLHHLRGLPMASSPRHLEFSNKMVILHEIQQFRMIMQIKNATTTIFAFLEHFAWLCENFAWSCEITSSKFPLMLQPPPFCLISHDCAKISHGHAKPTIMLFRLLFTTSLISSCLIHLHHLQLSFKAWFKCISSSSWPHYVPSSIHFPFVTPCFKNHLRISPKLNKNHKYHL